MYEEGKKKGKVKSVLPKNASKYWQYASEKKQERK
jgi:hypothetical protein